jgi:hypothetical protein
VIATVVAGFAVGNARADVAWCGHDEVSANRTPELTLGQTIRFVYAVPSDGRDNFAAYASGIATDAADIDRWWRAQDPTRAPRFDRYGFPGCTTTFGDLDIGFVRLAKPGSAYDAGDVFTALWFDLVASLPSDQRTIVYWDGPTSTDPDACGRTSSIDH